MSNYIFISVIIFLLLLLILPKISLFTTSEDSVYYIPNFLSNEDFLTVKTICESIDESNLKNENFRKVIPLNNEIIENIFYSNDVLNKIINKTNTTVFKSEFPIEYRIYPTHSPGMHCHIDTLLYELPQYEAVYTIHNDSDSITNWYDKNLNNNKISTEPNSLLLVRANGNKHCVSKLNRGTRSILKLIYTQTDKINNRYLHELNRFNF